MSESIEMYLKTIMELSAEDEPVAIARVAKRLGVSTVSANEMMKRLGEQDLIAHTPYKGVGLTEEGTRRAMSVVRRHRLWERFLVDHLGINWALAHDPACQLEHSAGEVVTEALAAFLGHPATCPHGNEIPGSDGSLAQISALPLSEMAVGDEGVIRRIYPEETTLLEHLNQRGMRPGASIRVEDIAPYNGPITLRVDEQNAVIGRVIAAHVFVEGNPSV